MLSKLLLPRSIQAPSEQILGVEERTRELKTLVTVPAVLRRVAIAAAHIRCEILGFMVSIEWCQRDGRRSLKDIYLTFGRSHLSRRSLPSLGRSTHFNAHWP